MNNFVVKRPFRLNSVNSRTYTPGISLDERTDAYVDFNEVYENIPIQTRALGLTIPIITENGVVEYWFQSGIENQDLVVKHDPDLPRIDSTLIYLQNQINQLHNIEFHVVQELPAVGNPNWIYMLSIEDPSGQNNYNEYVWLIDEQKYEKFGGIDNQYVTINNYYSFDSNVFKETQENNGYTNISLKDSHIHITQNYTEYVSTNNLSRFRIRENAINSNKQFIELDLENTDYDYQNILNITGEGVSFKYKENGVDKRQVLVLNRNSFTCNIDYGVITTYNNAFQITSNSTDYSEYGKLYINADRGVLQAKDANNITSYISITTEAGWIKSKKIYLYDAETNTKYSELSKYTLPDTLSRADYRDFLNISNSVQLAQNQALRILGSDYSETWIEDGTLKVHSSNVQTGECYELGVWGTNVYGAYIKLGTDTENSLQINYNEAILGDLNRGFRTNYSPSGTQKAVQMSANSGMSYLRMYDTVGTYNLGSIEMAIDSSNSLGDIIIKNNGIGTIQLYKNNNNIQSEFYIDDNATYSNINIRRKDTSNVTGDEGLIQINEDGILLYTKRDDALDDYKYIALSTTDHSIKVAKTKLQIGKSNGSIKVFQDIPECIYPLLYDLNYSNNISISDGGYWQGNAGQSDLRNIQRFTSIIPVDNDYSYVEFKKENITSIAYLSNDFNIKAFSRRSINKYDGLLTVSGKDLTFKSNKNNGTIIKTIELSFDEDNGLAIGFVSSGIYINFDATGITFIDDNTQTTLSKTWQQLLS